MDAESAILSGQAPSTTGANTPATPATVPVAVPGEDPNLTVEQKLQIEKEVYEDYYKLPSQAMLNKRRNNPNYEAAFQRLMNGTPTEMPSETTEGTETPVVPAETVPVSTEVPPTTTAVVEPEEPTEEGDPIKGPDGLWTVTIDLEDGGGVQVFKGKTKNEVIRALRQAQINASRKIRQQDHANRMKAALADPEVVEPATRFAPRELSADEQWEIANSLNDPAKSLKALNKWAEAQFGAPIDVVRDRLNRSVDQEELQRAAIVGQNWADKTPDFYNCQENRDKIQAFFDEKKWAVTERNLDIAFNRLSESGELVMRPAPTPRVEPKPAAAGTTPATATQTKTPAITPAVPANAVVRPAPGSASTGMSPRNSSVTGPAKAATKVELSVEEYRKMPAADVRRRYNSDRVFRASVDALIDKGLI